MRSITTLSDNEINIEIMRMDNKIHDLEGKPDLMSKMQVEAAKSMRFALMCRARARGLLIIKPESAPTPERSNVVSLADYRARRAK